MTSNFTTQSHQLPCYENLFGDMDIHRLLYEWLNRTDRDQWSEALWLTEPDMPFEQWWKENEEGLTNLADDDWCFQQVTSVDDYERNKWGDDEPELCVFVNMYNTKEALIEGFKQLLKEKHAGKVGRPKPRIYSDFEWCEVSGELTMRTLEIMLTVYDLRQKTSLKLWQIGEMLNMNPSQITLPDDPHKVLVAKKSVMNATVSRYLKWADTLKKNLCAGRFPRYK